MKYQLLTYAKLQHIKNILYFFIKKFKEKCTLRTLHSKKFWGANRKIPRFVMGNCNFPVSDQLMVQFGQMLPVSDQFLVQYGQILLFQTKICLNWTKSLKQENCIFSFGTSAFCCRRPKNFLSVGSVYISSASKRLLSMIEKNYLLFVHSQKLILGFLSVSF